MKKLYVRMSDRLAYAVCRKSLARLSIFLIMIAIRSGLYAQDPPCVVKCGTREMTCAEAQSYLCGKFTGKIDVTVPNPQVPTQSITISSIDLAMVLDDFGSGPNDWRGYVYAPESLVYPIVVNPDYPADSGPRVSGSHCNRTCTEQTPCVLGSEPFRTEVSGANARRQFLLTITGIEKDGERPRAIAGTYLEQITEYIPGRTVEVKGTFRMERQLSIAERP